MNKFDTLWYIFFSFQTEDYLSESDEDESMKERKGTILLKSLTQHQNEQIKVTLTSNTLNTSSTKCLYFPIRNQEQHKRREEEHNIWNYWIKDKYSNAIVFLSLIITHQPNNNNTNNWQDTKQRIHINPGKSSWQKGNDFTWTQRFAIQFLIKCFRINESELNWSYQ